MVKTANVASKDTDRLPGRDNDGGLRKIISQIGPKNGLIGGKNAGLIDLSRAEGRREGLKGGEDTSSIVSLQPGATDAKSTPFLKSRSR